MGDADPGRQHEVAEAFMAASRGGSFEALVAVLAPDVVLRVDFGPGRRLEEARGNEVVAGRALMFRRYAHGNRLALVNGTVGIVSAPEGRLVAVVGLTVVGGRIAEMTILADRERLARVQILG